MRKIIAVLMLVCQVAMALAADSRKNIIVSDQAQFDALDATLKSNLKRGVTELTVTLQSGVYYYGERHLDFSSLTLPNANVTLTGSNAMLIAKNLGRERSWTDGTYDVRRKVNVDRWSAMEQSPMDVDVVDIDSKLCRIRTAKRQQVQRADQCKGQYIQITQWYSAKVYPIVRRDRRYIYFTATDLVYQEQYGQWNVNIDMMYGKCPPRYRTLHPEIAASVRYCQASTFVNLNRSSMGSFTIRGISFGPNNGESPLIDTDKFHSRELRIEGCTFSGVRGDVVKLYFTDNAKVTGNRFFDCYKNGVVSYSGSRRTQVTGNTFRNQGQGIGQYFGVICRGEDFLIKGNTFRNFCYAAIGVGVWYGHTPEGPITGQVTGNDIAFDQDYYDDYAQHTLMDGGAIYTWTLCDKVSITDNKINRYRGVKDYRGIFCDDGGKNLTVRNNTVTNIGQDCWCIDLRWVENVKSKVPDHNTGNDISGNKVDGKVRFEIRKP